MIFCLLLTRVVVDGQRVLPIEPQSPTALVKTELVTQYLDPKDGMTADAAVSYALAHNAELDAARKEIESARALVKQARLRANPRLDIEATRQFPPGKDNSIMAEYFTEPYPARAAVGVASLPRGALVEADAVMALDR